jgi:flagellar hook assembly protein FlgD
MSAGPHAVQWDGRDAAGHRVPNGIYFIRLRTGDTGREVVRPIVRMH